MSKWGVNMDEALAQARQQVNHARYRAGQTNGHYESFFQRANHPTRPLAFWIRYTVFSPHGRPQDAMGELWAIWFDGERQQHVAVKEEFPVGSFSFDTQKFEVAIGDARLQPGGLKGTARSKQHSIVWDLTFQGDADPLFLLPLSRYEASLPAAKSLVGLPFAVYDGTIMVDGEKIDIQHWVGSQNHNW
jgi:hypothetical protein